MSGHKTGMLDDSRLLSSKVVVLHYVVPNRQYFSRVVLILCLGLVAGVPHRHQTNSHSDWQSLLELMRSNREKAYQGSELQQLLQGLKSDSELFSELVIDVLSLAGVRVITRDGLDLRLMGVKLHPQLSQTGKSLSTAHLVVSGESRFRQMKAETGRGVLIQQGRDIAEQGLKQGLFLLQGDEVPELYRRTYQRAQDEAEARRIGGWEF